MQSTSQQQNEAISQAPAIGAIWPGQGGIYAGLMRGDAGQPDYHLIVASVELGELKWKDAVATAELLSVDGHADFALPTRRELRFAWVQLADQFEKDWYWSGEQYASDPGYAWCQGFVTGYQDHGHKTGELRARAVRRLVFSNSSIRKSTSE